MSIKLTGKEEFQNKLAEVKAGAFSKELMGLLSGEAIDMIQQRTQKGKDVDNKAFKKYSTGYLAQKEKRAGGSVSTVDLFDKDHMQGAMTFKASERRAILFFTKGEESTKAAAHHFGKGKLPKREWFGLSNSDLEVLNALRRAELKRLVNK